MTISVDTPRPTAYDRHVSTNETRPGARYFYLRDHDGHPVGVVAMRRELDPTGSPVAVRVRVAMSVCAPVDRFDRRIGVARAIGRLDSETQSTCAETLGLAWRSLLPFPDLDRVHYGRAAETFAAQRSRLLRDGKHPDA